MAGENIQDYLSAIDPSLLDYGDWLMVGMAIKAEGLPVSVWDEWSQNDSRYDPRTIDEKWDSFQSQGVTGGSIAHLAKEYGYTKPKLKILEWNAVIGSKSSKEVHVPESPSTWNPQKQLIEYLETLHDGDDLVNIVVVAKWDEKKKKWKPGTRGMTLSVDEWIDKLTKAPDMEQCFGMVNEEAGAWIRLNPLDGKGVENDNTVKFNYALIESDEMPLSEQMKFFKESKLPIKMVINSGGKSLHAVVNLGAKTRREFDRRVLTLFNYCAANGFVIDKNNKNCSRLSRAPGFIRGENKQFIVAREMGCKDWEEFDKFRQLPMVPEPVPISWDIVEHNEKRDWIAEGLIAEHTKTMIAAAPKSGKTMLAIQLALAFATGGMFMNRFRCKQMKVLYIDGEVGRQTFVERLKNVAYAMGINRSSEIFGANPMIEYMDGTQEYELMNMTDSMIEKFKSKNYGLIIIDPIYLLFEGDESSSEDANKFMKILNKLKDGLNCSIVFVHHHSKGLQGEKASWDRYSGSGVFARNVDTLMDLSNINTETGDTAARVTAFRQCRALNEYGKKNLANWSDVDSDDPGEIGNKMRKYYGMTFEEIDEITSPFVNKPIKAFMVSGTVRHFEDFEPFKVIYDYPLHVPDDRNLLERSFVTGSAQDQKQRGADTSKSNRDREKEELNVKLVEMFRYLEETRPNEVTKSMMFDEWHARGYKAINKHTFEDNWLKNAFDFVENPCNKSQKLLRIKTSPSPSTI